MVAATAWGVLGGASVLGVVASGILSDRIGRKDILAAFYFMRAIAVLLLFMVNDAAQLYLMSAIIGLGWSAPAPLTGALTGDSFGRLSVGSLFGWIFLSHQLGSGISAYLGGLSFDLTNSYLLPFASASLILLAGSVVSFSIRETGFRRPPQHRPASPEGS